MCGKTGFISVLLFLLWQSVLCQVDTRLTFVSNSRVAQSDSLNVLVIDIEARSNSDSASVIYGFQGAFRLNEAFRNQNPSVSFSDQLFSSGNYNTTEDYRASKDRIRYVYTYHTGTPGIIESSWTRIVRVSIQYTRTDDPLKVGWYDGIPKYIVIDSNDNDVTGIREVIADDFIKKSEKINQ